MFELLKNGRIKEKIKYDRYFIQYFDKRWRKWYSITENIWLKSYNFSKERETYDKLAECWQQYGEHGILDKRLAISYLNDLRKAFEEKSDDFRYAGHIKLEFIGGFRLCKASYDINARVIK